MFNMLKSYKSPKSPNFGERKDGKTPSLLILHYTDMPAKASLERLCDPQAEVSAHYLVDEKGRIYALVPEDKRAWHAGVSYWVGENDINSASIGIEIVNPGHSNGYIPFPNKQLQKTVALCKNIIERWNIRPADILGHSDIAPGRKIDPGHLFPWEKLANEGVGLWPRPTEMDYQSSEDIMLDLSRQRELLSAYGYNLEVALEDVLTAFMRHFQPEKFKNWDDTPAPDILTFARLLALLRAKSEDAS